MTQEEKAKAYDEAIAKAQKELQTCGSTDCDAARQIYRFFPELSESEDKRIRKSIIAIINNYVDNSNTFKPKMVAWLEKQGEEDSSIQQAYKQGYIEGQRIERKCWLEKQSEKSTLPKWKYKKDNTPLLRDSIILNKYGCVLKSPSGAVVSDAWVLDYDELAKLPKEEIAKQGESKYIPKYRIGDYVKNTNYKGEPIYEIIYMDKECYICEYRGKESMGDKAVMHFSFDNPYLRLVQKSTDKVEPKFKVGDFIANDYCFGKVIEITNDAYLLDTGQGIPFSCEHNAHLWTINDAKDGDVLACEDGWTCIFKSLNDDDTFGSYCFMDSTKWFCEKGSECHTLNTEYMKAYHGEIKPATKEQRDTLMKAMADAGYTFDFEKKELKKIEWKPADKEYTFKAIPRLLEMIQPTDKAKSYCQKLIDSLEQEGYSTDAKIVRDCLKQMNGEKVAMATMDEQNLSNSVNIGKDEESKWTEEDEHHFRMCLECVEECAFQDREDFSKTTDWLKSLKYRYNWKPSEEHIHWLKWVVNKMPDTEKANEAEAVL